MHEKMSRENQEKKLPVLVLKSAVFAQRKKHEERKATRMVRSSALMTVAVRSFETSLNFY
jgi:hypothetical protein